MVAAPMQGDNDEEPQPPANTSPSPTVAPAARGAGSSSSARDAPPRQQPSREEKGAGMARARALASGGELIAPGVVSTASPTNITDGVASDISTTHLDQTVDNSSLTTESEVAMVCEEQTIDVASLLSSATGAAAQAAGPSGSAAAKAHRPSVNLDSAAYKTAEARTPIKIVGAPIMYCRKHGVYHVCPYTRKRAIGEAGDGAAGSSRGVAGSSGHAGVQAGRAREAEPDDIEDLPKALKRHSKRTQELMNTLLPTDTPPHSPLAKMLYRAHVYMITHGAVLCGETPQCGDCPLQSVCEYGSLLRAEGPLKANYKIPPSDLQSPATALAAAPTDLVAGDTTPAAALSGPSMPSLSASASASASMAASTAVLSTTAGAMEIDSHLTPASTLSSVDTQQVADEATPMLAELPTAGSSVQAADDFPACVGMGADGSTGAEDDEALAAAIAKRIILNALAVDATGDLHAASGVPPPLSSAELLAAARAVAANVASDDDDEPAASGLPGGSSSQQHEHICQMSYARVVNNPAVAPSHPQDATPRLLLVQSTIGDYAKGRLLMSPWTAFSGVFPMHGTYFAQNEVFEDEAAGEVTLPLASLGAERRVYLGRSIEGILRHRSAAHLTALFKKSFICIRRFRSTDKRLLPLVLDSPRLIKHKADQSALALQVGLARPMVPTVDAMGVSGATAGAAANASWAAVLLDPALTEPLDDMDTDPDGALALDQPAAGAEDANDALAPSPAEQPLEASAEEAMADEVYKAALARGVHLFKLYVAAGGALCLRHVVWRRLMPALHPDKGGNTKVFQVLSELKRRVDAGEEVSLPQGLTAMIWEGDAVQAAEEGLYAKLRAELETAAQSAGALAMDRLQEMLM